ncbi:MAG TPA: tetratricopeptide repeat protein [Kiritimatiellia bacterium]|nr:tetratricopeptide repeat protein [Kiritimatiellia bacterium]
MNTTRRIAGLLVIWVALLLLGGSPGYAQNEVPVDAIPDAITSDLRFTVTRMATGGRLIEAVPYLEELVRRFEASRGARFEQELERFYFLLSAAFMQLENYDDAIDVLKKHVEKFSTANDGPTAMEWLGDCHVQLGDHANAATVYQQLRNRHQLRGRALNEILAKETSSLAHLERWEDAVPLLRTLMAQAHDAVLRGQAATLLVRSYLALDQVAEIVKLLPQLLSISQARYEADFNIMLIHGGDTKYHAGDYDNALLLYQLALTKEELLAWHDEQISALEESLRSRSVTLDFKAATAVRTRLRALREGREDIARRDSFTEELLFRKGQTYFEMKQKWEAFWTFWSIWKTLPQSELTRQALFSAFVLAAELNMESRAVEFGYAFIDSFGVGDFFDEVTLQLANLHLRRKEYAEAIEISNRARAMNPDHAFADRLLFISGYSLFQSGDLTAALVAFHEVREKHPDSESEEGAIYWIGMTHLFLQDFEAARDEFSEFCARYIGGVYFEDARFRLGVAEYGLTEFNASREHFERFIEQFPGSVLRSEAHSFLGDIAGSQGRLNDAVEHYRLVAKHTDQMQQINYAAFQIGKIYELQERFEDMAEFFDQYMQTYRLEGQYTEALHRLGFARKMLGDVDGMLKTYEDAIRRYSHRIDALGIDLIIRDWVTTYRSIRGECPIDWLRKEWAAGIDKKSDVSRLRMMWALNDLCGEPAPESFEQVELRHASPAVLEWMGRISARSQTAFARLALEKVVEEFTESPWVEPALASWAELEASAGHASKALSLYERLFDQFPTGNHAGFAVKRGADMKMAMRRHDEAIKDYLRVLEIREWRGPLWPESLFRIGQILREQGKLQEAFGYFQRVYVLYAGYPEWAAQAYLQSGLVLERLNRRREAIATYTEMLAHDAYREMAPAREAEQRLAALQ